MSLFLSVFLTFGVVLVIRAPRSMLGRNSVFPGLPSLSRCGVEPLLRGGDGAQGPGRPSGGPPAHLSLACRRSGSEEGWKEAASQSGRWAESTHGQNSWAQRGWNRAEPASHGAPPPPSLAVKCHSNGPPCLRGAKGEEGEEGPGLPPHSSGLRSSCLRSSHRVGEFLFKERFTNTLTWQNPLSLAYVTPERKIIQSG